MLIAYDLGTSSIKASLFEADGVLIASSTTKYPTHFAAGGQAEQDPEQWWQAVVASTRELIVRAGVPASKIEGICTAGQMMAAVCLDAAHRPTRPAPIWSDQRATGQAQQLADRLGADQLYRLTGHRVSAGYTLPKLAWIAEHDPAAFAATRAVCLTKDYVNLRLTGVLATDHSDASSTGAYDLTAGCWSEEVIEAAGLDADLFAPLCESTQILGTLTAQAADELGLPRTVQVIAGGGDGPMASVAAGALAPSDDAYVSLGTSAWYSTVTHSPLFDPARRGFTFRHVVPGLFAPCATTQSGAATLDWFAESVGSSAIELASQATQVSAATDGLYFLPYLLGERVPWWDANASGVFAGMRMHHGRAHLARAVMEGVGFALGLCRAALADGDHELRPVNVIGGGANSDTWLQLFADAWAVPVRRLNITTEATSLGAAVTGLVGLGRADFELARQLGQVVAEFVPGDSSPQLRRASDRFTNLYSDLAPWFGASAAEEA